MSRAYGQVDRQFVDGFDTAMPVLEAGRACRPRPCRPIAPYSSFSTRGDLLNLARQTRNLRASMLAPRKQFSGGGKGVERGVAAELSADHQEDGGSHGRPGIRHDPDRRHDFSQSDTRASRSYRMRWRESRLGREFDRVFHIADGHILEVCAYELIGGQFECVEAFCCNHGIAFVRRSDACSGAFGPERAVHTGDRAPRHYEVNDADQIVLNQRELNDLGSIAAANAWFQAGDFALPPLSIGTRESPSLCRENGDG